MAPRCLATQSNTPYAKYTSEVAVLNLTLCCEKVWGNTGITPGILNLATDVARVDRNSFSISVDEKWRRTNIQYLRIRRSFYALYVKIAQCQTLTNISRMRKFERCLYTEIWTSRHRATRTADTILKWLVKNAFWNCLLKIKRLSPVVLLGSYTLVLCFIFYVLFGSGRKDTVYVCMYAYLVMGVKAVLQRKKIKKRGKINDWSNWMEAMWNGRKGKYTESRDAYVDIRVHQLWVVTLMKLQDTTKIKVKP